MDKIKKTEKNILRKSLIRYYAFFILLAFLLSAITFFSANRFAENIRNSYPPTGERYYLTNEKGESFGDGVIVDTEQMPLSKEDEILINVLGVIPVIMSPFWFLVCIIIATLLFYKTKLKTPFTELKKASENIADNNLDFTIEYKSKDELGQLCSSFEIMRSTLSQNFSDLYRQTEERKSLNAAFAHDLRTPLTVLKGQSDMLIKYSSGMSSDKVRGTADMMKRHIERLEAYVNTMNNLQRLEDIEIEKEFVVLSDIEAQLRIAGASIYKDKGLAFTINALKNNQVKVDFSVVMQVCENLLANASRYANSTITLSISIQGDFLVIEIADDGKGFTDDELLNATKPFYKRNADDDSEHFGMGLNISKILCEKHGGYLKLKNNNGAIITAAFRQ